MLRNSPKFKEESASVTLHIAETAIDTAADSSVKLGCVQTLMRCKHVYVPSYHFVRGVQSANLAPPPAGSELEMRVRSSASQGIDSIRHIPCIAVQGGMDFICPVRTRHADEFLQTAPTIEPVAKLSVDAIAVEKLHDARTSPLHRIPGAWSHN